MIEVTLTKDFQAINVNVNSIIDIVPLEQTQRIRGQDWCVTRIDFKDVESIYVFESHREIRNKIALAGGNVVQ